MSKYYICVNLIIHMQWDKLNFLRTDWKALNIAKLEPRFNSELILMHICDVPSAD